MTNPFDPWAARLSEYLDGELRADMRQAIEAHLTTCSECTRLMADLEAVRNWLRADAPSPHDLEAPAAWPMVLERIHVQRRRRRVHGWAFATAASVLIALTGAYLAVRASGPTDSAISATADLERAYAAASPRLTPPLRSGVTAALFVLEAAIADTRKTMAQSPHDRVLESYLRVLERRRIDLLRRAVDLAWPTRNVPPTHFISQEPSC